MKIPEEYVDLLIPIFLTFLGAVLHATNQLKISREKNEDFSLIDFIILLVTSGLSGVFFTLFISVYITDPIMLGAFGGIGGYLGIRGMASISNIGLKFLEKFTK